MKLLQNKRFGFAILVLALGVAVLNAVFRVPSTEGFNPSDDGVILAQSYRLLQGEIPHKDFISIRPVGSAVMHLVHFFSPLPLMLSSRWAVLAEYFLYSLLFAMFLTGSSGSRAERKGGVFVGAGITFFMFLLNVNHYNLFPWTTIDALLWFSAALYSWSRILLSPGSRNYFNFFLLFFGISGSVLCRQTFILPGIWLAGAALVKISGTRAGLKSAAKPVCVSRRVVLMRLLSALAGLLPGWIYAAMLTFSGGWAEFLRQMTGRTELWETGFAKFSDNFWETPVWFGFLIVIIIGLILSWEPAKERQVRNLTNLLSGLQIAAGIIVLGLSAAIFFSPRHLFSWSFGLFWLLILQLLIIRIRYHKMVPYAPMAGWVVFVAWTGSLSLGDNAPVFSTGLLAGANLLLVINSFPFQMNPIWQLRLKVAAGISLALLTGLSIKVQKEVNYRDRPAEFQTASLGAIFDGMKGICTNPEIFNYLSEIKKVYKECGSPQGRFAVWPNNALIYALLNSPNPFPLDWMQGPEFPGSEDRIIQDLRREMTSKELFILVEKYNVKWLATEKIPLDTGSADYPYLALLEEYGTEVMIGNPWFRVFRTR